jgi:hypothetical protein
MLWMGLEVVMTRSLMLAALALVVLAAPALADVVHLKNGRTIEGTVTKLGDKVNVKTQFGSISLASSEVVRIEKKSTIEEQFRTRRAALKDNDLEGRLALALWLRSEGFKVLATRELQAIVKADPLHRGAHHTLGHVRFNGKWMTRNDSMKAQGYVKFEGRWVTAEEKVFLTRDAAFRAQVSGLQAKVTALIRAMSSPSPSIRVRYYRDLITLARKVKSPELEKAANEVKAWYDKAYRVLAERALLEVRATVASLKRPIPTLSTSLGAGTTPVTIHLPELAIISIGTTVSVPAGR